MQDVKGTPTKRRLLNVQSQNVWLQDVQITKHLVYQTSTLPNVQLQNVQLKNVHTSNYYKTSSLENILSCFLYCFENSKCYWKKPELIADSACLLNFQPLLCTHINLQGTACDQLICCIIYSVFKLKSYKKTPHYSIICFTWPAGHTQ